jgi:hypothetical protein
MFVYNKNKTMRKHLLIILITLFSVKINAQCTVATFSYSQGFEAFNGVMPTCWTTPSPSNVMSRNTGGGAGGTAGYLDVECLDGATRYFAMPKVVNANGILNVKGKRIINANSTRMEVGVMTNPSVASTFSVMSTIFLGTTNYSAYSVNLSSYTGTGQYIAIRISPMITGNSVRAYLDDINYVSYCSSSSVTAIAQNYTVQLNNSGTAAITTTNINNGSTSGCGNPTLSLSQTNFNCSNIGVNTVTLTAIDNASNTATATASVTVLPAINDETLSTLQSTICTGNSATITTGSSVSGIKYYLRDDATNNIVVGPVTGTGGNLSFNTGTLTSNTTYNVYAETQSPGNKGLDFDGTNDVITTNITSSTTNSLTLEAWIFPRATTVKRIISNYFNNAAQSGEFILDTYNVTNNGRGLRLAVEGAGNTLHQLSVANVLTLNAWNHVAGTFNNGVTTLYVNGTAVATSTAPFTSMPGCTNTLTFGEDPTIGALEYFNGKMDDIRIWNTARTQSDIAGNMNNCLVGNESGLKNYFKLSENAGSTVTDLVTGSIGNMSGMTPATAWVTGNVECGGAICNREMSQLVTINVNSAPTISVNSGSVCSGNSFTITPSGASTYTIQGGGAVKTPTANTTYTVIGTSSIGCVSSTFATSSITVNATPTVAVNNGSICAGNSFTINPSGASTYTIQGGSAIKTPTANTNYTVVGTSSLGCVSNTFATSSVTVNAAPTITVNSGSICAGSNFTIIPNGANTYSIQGGNNVVNPISNATYTVIGYSSAGCASSNVPTSNVTVNATPTISVNSGSICAGNNFTIVPSGANTYTIQGGNSIVNPTSNATYTVTGTNSNGCKSSTFATANVTVNSLPTISVNSGSICSGNSFTITPSGASTYTFSNGNIVSPIANTNYTVSGTNSNGCINSTVSSVTVNATPTITIASGVICPGNSFTLSPNGASTYTYSSGSAVVSPTTTTTYSVDGTSNAGCVTNNPAVATVTVANTLNITITGANTICEGQTANLTVGGASTYTWNTGAISSTIAPSPTTNTSYSVIGASGSCSNTAVVNVTVNTLPTINATTNNTLLCVGQTASLTANGTATSYTWNTNETGSIIAVSPTVTTNYTVTGTDVNGCENNAVITQDVSLCTGINNITTNNNIMTLFPNPSSSILTIQTTEEIKEVYIFNTLGDLVRTENTNTFSVEHLSSGIYMIHVKTEKGINTLRFIRE